MSVIKLQRVDNSDLSNIELKLPVPCVIGQGTSLQCTDTSLPINHGVLDWDEDGITIQSTHTSPLFVKTNGLIRPLSQNESVLLKNNDEFGLMEKCYWYRLILPHDDELNSNKETVIKDHLSTETLQSEADNSADQPIKDKPDIENQDSDVQNPDTILGDSVEKSVTPVENEEPCVVKKETVPSYSPIKTTRKLPSWIQSASSGTDKPDGQQSNEISTNESKEMELKSPPKKRPLQQNLPVNSVSPEKKAKYHEMSDEEIVKEPENEVSSSSIPPSDLSAECKLDDSNNDNENNHEEENDDKIDARRSCKYGSNCYRNNPAHKTEEAHPGDTDYESMDDEDDREECEYGTNCYRRNPAHKRKYKHTVSVRPKRKAARKANVQMFGDDDEFDSDNEFINDDSSDDYAPTESDSDSDYKPDGTEEDTKRTLKEGKKFIRKKR